MKDRGVHAQCRFLAGHQEHCEFTPSPKETLSTPVPSQGHNVLVKSLHVPYGVDYACLSGGPHCGWGGGASRGQIQGLPYHLQNSWERLIQLGRHSTNTMSSVLSLFLLASAIPSSLHAHISPILRYTLHLQGYLTVTEYEKCAKTAERRSPLCDCFCNGA